MRIRIELEPVTAVVNRLGLAPNGRAQKFHTNNVMRRMAKYMPYRTGATIKLMIAQTDISRPEIIVPGPYAQYLYYGKRMVNAKTGKGPAMIPGVGLRFPRGSQLKVTDIPLEYTVTKNPQAGPFWDQRLAAAEGDILARELEDFIKRGDGA